MDEFAFLFTYLFVCLFIVCHVHYEGTKQLGNSADQQVIYCTLSENIQTLKPQKKKKVLKNNILK